jgi:hypothetical protein
MTRDIPCNACMPEPVYTPRNDSGVGIRNGESWRSFGLSELDLSRLIPVYLLSHNTIHSTSRALFIESAEQTDVPPARHPCETTICCSFSVHSLASLVTTKGPVWYSFMSSFTISFTTSIANSLPNSLVSFSENSLSQS